MRSVTKTETGPAANVEAWRRALAAAGTPAEVRMVYRLAEKLRRHASEEKWAREKQQEFGTLRIEALIKLSKTLDELDVRRGRPKNVQGRDNFPRLADLGISRNLSALARKVAAVPDLMYRRYLDDARQHGWDITPSGLLEYVDPVKRSQHFTGRGEARRLYELTCKVIAEHGIEFDCWLEPSAGDGAFYDLLPSNQRLGIDIDPPRDDLIAADFLTFDDFAPGRTYAAIGNPPWGENGAVRFFNRCADHCSVIAFVVPRSFLRPHAINQLDRRFRRLHEEELWRGQPPAFASVFQIWARVANLREPIVTPNEHPDFEFLPQDRPDVREAADIAIRRIGVNAGKILNPSKVSRADTAHWIRCRPGVDVDRVRDRIRTIDWTDAKYIDAEGHRDRGYPSLSRAAIVDEYERRGTEPIHDPDARYIHYGDPYHTVGGGVRLCKYPQTTRFIANVEVPLDFDLAAHLRAVFATDR